jgi:hypothetical protein
METRPILRTWKWNQETHMRHETLIWSCHFVARHGDMSNPPKRFVLFRNTTQILSNLKCDEPQAEPHLHYATNGSVIQPLAFRVWTAVPDWKASSFEMWKTAFSILSSWLYGRVARRNSADVSEKHWPPFSGSKNKPRNKPALLSLTIPFTLFHSGLFFDLEDGVLRSSETLADSWWPTWCYNTEVVPLHSFHFLAVSIATF